RFVVGYPYFGMHIIEMALRVVSLTGYDTFSDNEIFFMSRWLNVAYACGMIALIYKVGALLGHKRAGLLGAVLLASSFAHNQMCKYLGADIAMSFFALLAVYVATLILKSERNRYYALFGVVAGISAACKYNGIFIFFFLGFVFLTLHPRLCDLWKNAPRLIMAVLVSILTFVLLNANILSAPAKAIDSIRGALALSSSFGLKDASFDVKLKALMDFDYNFFVVEGLFQPVPLWLAILALALFIYKYRWRHVYLWATPCVIFILGKISMPISASHHYLNIIPLLLLATAIGVDEMAKITGKKIQMVLPVILALYVGYYAVQDNSFWTLKPVSAQNASWVESNLAITPKTRELIKAVQSFEAPKEDGKSGTRRIRHFYNVMNEQAVSLHRDSHFEIIMNPKLTPLLYPPVHFIEKNVKNTIYPASHDIVTTDKAFLTGNLFGYTPSVTKLVMAEKPMKRLMVWVRNCSNKKNEVILRVGNKKFKYKLEPFEEAPLTIVDAPKRTFLYYGSLIKISAESDGFAAWRIAVNERDIGDLYLASGQKPLAVDAYLRSGNLYSLMQAAVNSGSREKRIKAIEKIKKLSPDLFKKEQDITYDSFWKNVAGYTDSIFRPLMTRPVAYDLLYTQKVKRQDRYSNTETTTPAWEIGDGGIIYGPYMPMLNGSYKISAEIMAKDNLESFIFDVSSDIGTKIIRAWTFEGNRLPSGSSYKKVSFEFEVRSPVEYPVEFRFHQIKGGSLLVKNIEITADYLSQTARLISETGEIANNLRQSK
ncbi:hypothetical protein MNBD_NITROSPINAE01-1750, partial [hydrothermal vent metagenome]